RGSRRRRHNDRNRARAIVREGIKAIASGINPMDLKRGIDRAVDAVVADLKAKSRSVTEHDELAQGGTISSNGDSAIGAMVADAMAKVGNDGAALGSQRRLHRIGKS